MSCINFSLKKQPYSFNHLNLLTPIKNQILAPAPLIGSQMKTERCHHPVVICCHYTFNYD